MNCFDLDDSMNLGAFDSTIYGEPGDPRGALWWMGPYRGPTNQYGTTFGPVTGPSSGPIAYYPPAPAPAPAPTPAPAPIPAPTPAPEPKGFLPDDFYIRNQGKPGAPVPQTPQWFDIYSVKSDIVSKIGGDDGKESLAAIAQSATSPIGAGVILAILGALIFRG